MAYWLTWVKDNHVACSSYHHYHQDAQRSDVLVVRIKG